MINVGWMKKMMEGIMGLRKAPLSKKHNIDERYDMRCEGFAKVLYFIIYFF